MEKEDLEKALAQEAQVTVDTPPPPLPAADAGAIDAEAAQETIISLSTVAPAKAAVFSRFDTLWIVVDSASAAEPEIDGPDEGFLGSPKTLKFQGGTAYRYALPKNRYVSVERKNLGWRVIIGQEARIPPAAA